MIPTPVLETERLVLRAHRIDDLDAFAAMWTHPEVARFTSGEPLNREEAWRRLVGHRGMWGLMGFGYFAIEEKGSETFIGSAGVQESMRAITPSLTGTMEAGWILTPQAHGKGYAREAMQAVLSWCGKAHPDKAVTCIINEENTPSRKLAARLGFHEHAQTHYKDRPTTVYLHGRSALTVSK